MWSMWDAPSDRDYYDEKNGGSEPEPEDPENLPGHGHWLEDFSEQILWQGGFDDADCPF